MIHSVTVQDFRTLSGNRTKELPPGITSIVGKNEAGKSTLVNAIAWALYGNLSLPKGVAATDVVNDHAQSCSVTLRFAFAGDEYELTRTQRRSGSGDATLLCNGSKLATGRDPVVKAVGDLFEVDHEGFMVSVFSRQDELDALADKAGSVRITTMLRLLGVEQADKAIGVVREQAREERRALDMLRAGAGDAVELDAELASLSEAMLRLQAEAAESEQEVTRASDEAARLRGVQEALRPKRELRSAWLKDRALAMLALQRAQDAYDDAAKRSKQEVDPELEPPEGWSDTLIAETQERIVALRTQYALSQAALADAQARMASTDSICPTCRRPFENAEEIEQEKVRAREDAERAQEEKDRAAEEGRTAARDMASYVQYADRSERRQAQLAAVALAEAEMQAIKDGRLAAAKAALEKLDADEPEDPEAEGRDTEDALFAAQQAKGAAERSLATITAQEKAAVANLARVQVALEQAKGRIEKVTAAEKRLVIVETASAEMGKMKEQLIGSIIPTLEEKASAIVADLTDGKHTELHLTPDYEIQYRAGAGEWRSFHSLSGGAQRVFALALRLAIADVRAGKVPFLVLDEVFESLDEDRVDLAYEAIEHLSKRYEQVLVVTHVPALRDRSASVITL